MDADPGSPLLGEEPFNAAEFNHVQPLTSSPIRTQNSQSEDIENSRDIFQVQTTTDQGRTRQENRQAARRLLFPISIPTIGQESSNHSSTTEVSSDQPEEDSTNQRFQLASHSSSDRNRSFMSQSSDDTRILPTTEIADIATTQSPNRTSSRVKTEQDVEELDSTGSEIDGDGIAEDVFKSFKDHKAEYDRKVRLGINTTNDDVDFRMRKIEYHTNLKKRREENMVDEEEMQAARADEDFKKNSPESIMKREKSRARHTELEFNKERLSKKTSSKHEESTTESVFKRKRSSTFCASHYLPNVVYTTPTSKRSKNSHGRPKRKKSQTSRHQGKRQSDQNVPGAPVGAKFNTHQTREAFAQMAATCLASPEEAKEDKCQLREAKTFFKTTNLPRPDGDSGWKCTRMKTSLFSHQIIGCGFMLRREKACQEPMGGLFFDMMGFGKTIQMLSCIVDQWPEKRASNRNMGATLIVLPPGLVQHWKDEIRKHCEPEFVGQVLEYQSKNFANTSDPENILGKHGIVLVSYSEVEKSYPNDLLLGENLEDTEEFKDEFEKNCGPLHRIQFHRIVIDEGHLIKNPKTRTFRAVYALKAFRRWVLTGTPIIDGTEEIFSYCRFLRIPFTGSLDTFRSNYCDMDNETHPLRLTEALRPYVFRRDHEDTLFGAPILNLPEKIEYELSTKQNEFERAAHIALVEKYSKLITSCTATQTKGLIFKLILRLRQLNSHPLLLQTEFRTFSDEQLDKLQTIYEDMRHRDIGSEYNELQKELGMELTQKHGNRFGKYPPFQRFRNAIEASKTRTLVSTRICDSCQDTPVISKVKVCGHFLCKTCTDDSRLSSVCGECDVVIDELGMPSDENMDVYDDDEDYDLEPSTKSKSKKHSGSDSIPPEHDWLLFRGQVMPSRKLQAAKLKILEWLSEGPEVKVIIFTQWRKLIPILNRMCEMENWGCRIIEGQTSQSQRNKRKQEFEANRTVRILISTFRTGGLGLNLTAASKVLILDPWWNEACEQQAFARVYRPGQTRKTECARLLLKGTIDYRMLQVKGKKMEHFEKIVLKQDYKALKSAEFHQLFGPSEEEETSFIFEDQDAWLSAEEVPAVNDFTTEDEDDVSNYSSSE